MLTQRPRGTADLLPGEVEQWQWMEQVIRSVFARYNYGEIRTPVFEHTELFSRGVGETTDIVEREMYTFTDRSGRSLTLRPEGTAGVVRAFIEHKLHGQAGLTKLFYVGPMFRYEKPQKGRYRQLHQYGVEVFGAAGPAIDVEVIELNLEILNQLGLQGLTVEINSVGCNVCRPVHKERMVNALRPVAEQLCEDCQRRYERNPLRIFDCKNDHCHVVLKESGAPTIRESLCDDCHTHFEQVVEGLTALEIPFEVNENLVRGLDYYTRTAWEVTIAGSGSVAGGGRYDTLVEQCGGPATPGIGFAGGMERALLLLAAQQPDAELGDRNLDVYLVVTDKTAELAATQLLQHLRKHGFRAERDYQSRSVKSQFKQADREQARFVAVLGETEIISNTVTIKELATGVQQVISKDEVISYIGKDGQIK